MRICCKIYGSNFKFLTTVQYNIDLCFINTFFCGLNLKNISIFFCILAKQETREKFKKERENKKEKSKKVAFFAPKFERKWILLIN